MARKLATCSQVEIAIKGWKNLGGNVTEIEEGVLGYGTLLLWGLDGYKVTIITEVALNEWSSAHKVRHYKVMPKKYEKILQKRGEI